LSLLYSYIIKREVSYFAKISKTYKLQRHNKNMVKKEKKLVVDKLALEKLKLPEKKENAEKQSGEKKPEKEKIKKIEDEKLEEVLEKQEKVEEKLEENIGLGAGRSNFNPEILVMRSGQKLEQIEALPERRETREKDGKEEEKRQISYAQTQIQEERNYQGSTPLPVMPMQEVIRERAQGMSRRMDLIHPHGFQQQAPEEKLYETKRVEEEHGGMPWQSGHETEIRGARDIKYKVRA
jgi:hypothetical protein